MSAADPSVAIVMRTRDRPLFLERAVASAVAQTFTDYELVVVNDGGDPAAVDAVLARHPAPAGARVRALHHPERVGLRSPPNAPIRATRSRYVAVHDDDDTWAPRFLELAVGHLDATGAAGVVATTDRVVETVEGGRLVTLERTRLHPELRHLSLYAMCFENHATPIAFLYRRDAYEAVGGYDESLESVADWDFAIRFLTRFDVDLLRTPEALAFYHHRAGAGDAAAANAVSGESHRRLENALANTYLRRDLEAGRYGLGHVMNALRFDYEAGESLFRRQKEAVDERVDYLAACVEKADRRIMELQEAVTPAARLRADLRFVRSLPAKVARRALGKNPPA